MNSLLYQDALKIAVDLKSEHGENREYDRALLEYLWYAYGDDRLRNREDIASDMKLDVVSLYKTGKLES